MLKSKHFTLLVLVGLSATSVFAQGDPITRPFTILADLFAGPLARAVAVIAIVLGGLGMATNPDGGGKRTMGALILGLGMALGAVHESVEKTEDVKAALRSVLVEMWAPPRVRKLSDVDQLAWMVSMAAKATLPPRGAWARQEPYVETRALLWNILTSVYHQVPLSTVQSVMEAWANHGEYRRFVHSLRLLVAATPRFRWQPTQRISDSAVVELQNEYQRSASLFEQQLRLLTCLVRSAKVSHPWEYWQNQSLKNLMEMASTDPVLGKLIPFINRNVRNALVHGPPVVERRTRRCQFHDRDICVEWTWDELFTNTRALTLVVLACANLDNFRSFIEVQILVEALTPAAGYPLLPRSR